MSYKEHGTRARKLSSNNVELKKINSELLGILKEVHEQYAHYGKGYWVGMGQEVERLIAKAEGRT